MKSKDKGPMFAMLWKTRIVLRSISNNLKVCTITKLLKDKTEYNSGLRGLSCAVFFFFFFLLVFNNFDFPCM